MLGKDTEVRVETVYDDAGDANRVCMDGGWVGFEALHAYGRDSCVVAFPYYQPLVCVNRDWAREHHNEYYEKKLDNLLHHHVKLLYFLVFEIVCE